MVVKANESMASTELQYQVKRSARRRTVSLEVRDAQLLVRAPAGVSERELHRLVQRKKAWVWEKIRVQAQLLARIPSYDYLEGERLPWLGESLLLTLSQAPAGSVGREGDRLHVALSSRSRQAPQEQTRRLVQGWYRDQALALLEAKTGRLANDLGLTCREVKVRVTRSKWGHCTSRGAIQYNWQIVLAPEAVVDYLVAHEVCHLRHHNHSRAFWQLVEKVCPDYQRQRDWLKTNGRLLVL